MGTSAELVLWRSVDAAERLAGHFEGLLVQRAAERRAPWLLRLAQLERWRDQEAALLSNAVDKLAATTRALEAEQRWLRERSHQHLGPSALSFCWRALLVFCWLWVLESADSPGLLLGTQLPVAVMWLSAAVARRQT